MDFNQSFVKRLSKKYCPKKVKAELDGKHNRKISDAMVNGQYFEYALFGTRNREGKIPKMKRLKTGKKSTAQKRIEAQVKEFYKICFDLGIKFYGTDRTFKTQLFGYSTFGTWDGYGLVKGKPYIIDIKLTQNVENDFGDFCWGDIDSMDKLQADMYMEAGRKLDGLPYNFLYMVFDYKPKPSYQLHFVDYDKETSLRVQSRLEETESKITAHQIEGWPAVGVPDECKDCCFSAHCSEFITKDMIKDKWRKIESAKIIKQEDEDSAKKEIDDLMAGVFDEENFQF